MDIESPENHHRHSLHENVSFKFNCNTTMNDNEVDFLRSKLSQSNHYLEFGTGFSTIEACKLVKDTVVSIETSIEYLNSMSNHLSNLGILHSNVFLHHVDIGSTGDWGFPIDELAIRNWPRYSNLNFDQYSKLFQPDLALIDGRFRVATFLKLYLNYPGLSIMFDDYFDRPQYHVVENFTHPRTQVGRLALFKVPRLNKMRNLRIAGGMLSDYILIPE
jgi:hypothetical protein